MKIAIFGGAFNPSHLGHVLVAKQILEFTPTDQVWLMPCFRHTFHKELISANHRLIMARFLKSTNILVSDLEIINRLPGDTIDTMKLLEKNYPQHKFNFVMGSDNLPEFKKWGSWQELVGHWEFLVFPRPGFDYNLEKYGLLDPKFKFTLVKNDFLAISNISSTLIRSRLTNKLPIDYLLPEKVSDYIRKNKLYQ